MGVQTLVIGEPNSAAVAAAKRIGASTAEPTDIEGISNLIERIWLSGGCSFVPLVPIGYETIALRMDAVLRAEDGEIDDAAEAFRTDS
jgi:hypothetical protein